MAQNLTRVTIDLEEAEIKCLDEVGKKIGIRSRSLIVKTIVNEALYGDMLGLKQMPSLKPLPRSTKEKIMSILNRLPGSWR